MDTKYPLVMPRPRGQNVRLKPADPFDLIRWLARSQSDPRKAVAELVQNSIDAQARQVRIERRRLRRAQALIVRDDGEGILPALDREEALRTIATNIGHSRKRGLSPRERHEQVVLGKYGIGLLGFWAVGHRMDIRTRVSGGDIYVLRMIEDRENAEVVRERMPLESEDTFTEIVISELHDQAVRSLSARRLNDYLAAELRGALLASGVKVDILDGLARGLAQKHFSVVPRRFTGEPLALPSEIPVPGHPPLRVELYLARGLDRPMVEVSCAGTIVADDITELRALGLDRAPWLGNNLAGFIDFPSFNVPPGTRRGIVPDAAADAFVAALATIEPQVEVELNRLAQERTATTDRKVLLDLRRALRGLRYRLPQYELPAAAASPVKAAAPDEGVIPDVNGRGDGDPMPAQEGNGTSAAADEDEAAADVSAELHLFPPGPLHAVEIRPARPQLAPARERRVRAVARDVDGRVIDEGIVFEWRTASPLLTVVGQDQRPAIVSSPDARPGTELPLSVIARQGAREAAAETVVCIVEARATDSGTGFGIPEPELVDDRSSGWRSRFVGQRWQVNAGHEDYVALRADGRSRLRYLLMLLAREIALRTHGVPGADAVVDGVVEILAHAERNLRSG